MSISVIVQVEELISDFGRYPIGSGSSLKLFLLKKQKRDPLRSFCKKK